MVFRISRPGVKAAVTGVLLATGGAVVPAALTGPAAAQPVSHDRLVSAVPASSTPFITKGSWIKTIAQVGSKIFVGGQFTEVSQSGKKYTRNNIYAMDATTKKIDTTFAPDVSGEVLSIAGSPDGKAVYIGGWFGKVNGVGPASFQKLDAATGKKVTGFNTSPNNAVYDIKVTSAKVYIGGRFTKVNSVARSAFASVAPSNGGVQTTTNVPVTGVQNHGVTHVYKMAMSPDQKKLILLGNFSAVGGQERHQAAMVDISGTTAALKADWATTGYAAPCSSSAFDFYVRDADFSPDGSYLVIVTTGGPHGDTQLCDSAARYETNATGSDIKPTWVDWTGGDTLHSVAISPVAIYIGGHERWANNPFGSDSSQPGAVMRVGLGALDPKNGMPFTWNPGRDPKGIGAFELTLTSTGLYVGSDTDYFGPHKYYRGKIGFFPLSGGAVPPANATHALPGKVYIANSGLVSRSFNGTSAGSDTTVDSSGWSGVRGAALVDGTLWYAKSDGLFYKRSFNGSTFGTEQAVAPFNDSVWDAAHPEWKGTRANFYGLEASSVKGMFFADGRLYYTRSGLDDNLYYRYFTPESGVVGAQEFKAATSGWKGTSGMFVSGGKLYYAASNGDLRRISFANGAPSGSSELVDGTKNWSGNAMFLGAP